MAVATGLVCGMFVFAPIGVPTAGVLGFLFGQIATFSYVYGKRRGKLELQYLKYQRNMEIFNAIEHSGGYFRSILQVLSELGEISWSKGEEYESLLQTELSNDRKFLLLYKLGILSQKDRNYLKAISIFKQCLNAKPKDLLINFTMAQCYERQGDAKKAISAYQTASTEGAKLSRHLAKFINVQITRIKTNGPAKKPPRPGLRHLGLGR